MAIPICRSTAHGHITAIGGHSSTRVAVVVDLCGNVALDDVPISGGIVILLLIVPVGKCVPTWADPTMFPSNLVRDSNDNEIQL